MDKKGFKIGQRVIVVDGPRKGTVSVIFSEAFTSGIRDMDGTFLIHQILVPSIKSDRWVCAPVEWLEPLDDLCCPNEEEYAYLLS